MRTDLKFITCSLLVLSLASSTALGDTSTDAASGAASLINGAALGLTTVVNGVNQAQNMASFVGATAKMGAVGTQLGQANAAIAQAMAAEAACEQKASSKAKSSSSSAAAGTLKSILATTPTCTNYVDVWNQGLAWNAQYQAANDRFLCIKNMQTAMDAIATGQFKDQLKAYIDAANAAYDSQQAIVTNYDDMATKIKSDLGGENGYIAQLAKLQSAINQLQTTIGGSGGASSDVTIGDTSIQGGGNLSQQVKDLKIASNQVANGWMKSIISDAINNCFVSNGNIPCMDNGGGGQVNMSPLACIQNATNQTVGQNSVQGVLNGQNAKNITSLIQQQQNTLQNSLTAGNLDPSNMTSFTNYVKSQFSNALTGMSSQFNGIALNGSRISVAQLQAFYQSSMNQCFSQAMSNFKQDIDSQGPRYYASYSQLDTKKSAILTIENQATTSITTLMNQFVTNFSQNYSTGLSQFSANCSATNDPNAGLDCLKELKAQLESGINGNTVFAQLSTGGSYTASPSPTTITLQHLTLDANGSPTTVPDQQSCVGFNACITLMKQRETYDEGQSVVYKQKLVSFAKSANASITNVIGAASASFGIAAGKITSAVADLSSSLAALGVPATAGITMKKSDPASLTKDKDKNNLYSSDPMPDAKGLLGVSDMDPDSIKANSEAATEAQKKVLKKITEAAAMKSYCNVTKSDFKGLEKFLNSCKSPSAFCRGNTQNSIDSALQKILIHGQEMGSKPDSSLDSASTPDSLSTLIKDCKSDTTSTCSADPTIPTCSITALPNLPATTDPSYATQKAAYDKINNCADDRKSALNKCISDSNSGCMSDAQTTISASYKERDPLGSLTGDIEGAVSNLENACSQYQAAAVKNMSCPNLNKNSDGTVTYTDTAPTDSCNKDCADALNNMCSSCADLWNSMQKGVNDKDVPDKMPEGTSSNASDSGINSSDGFTNGFKKAN